MAKWLKLYLLSKITISILLLGSTCLADSVAPAEVSKGTRRTTYKINMQGNYVELSSTGQTSGHTFTFPDSTGQVLVSGSNTNIAGNLIVGSGSAGTSATRTLVLEIGTIPSTSPTSATQLYSEGSGGSYASVYPVAQSDTYVKATTVYSGYNAYQGTDPTLSLVGSWGDGAWLSANTVQTNQRFHIDLGSAKIVKRIYYENMHHVGAQTEDGVKNFTFWGSNSATAFAELTYAVDTDWTQITTAQSTFDQHTAANAPDPKYITVTNSTAYRYYAFKFADTYGAGSPAIMGFRRVELQTGLAELKVRDEAGNVTTLSPHTFTLFTPDASYELPFSYYSKNEYIGKEINVDIYGAIKEIEKLSGKKFIYIKDIEQKNMPTDRQFPAYITERAASEKALREAK